MRNTILAVVAVVWGGAMIVSDLVNGIPSPETSYGAGGLVAFLFGIALFAAGCWTLLKKRARG